VRGEIDGRNRTPVPLRHFCAGRQILNYRIAQRDFAALRHVGQQQCREHLRCRANFEYRVAVERTWIVLLQMPIGITRRPAGPMTPTTMPTLWCWRSIRSTSICRISASDGVVVFGGDWPSAKANMTTTSADVEIVPVTIYVVPISFPQAARAPCQYTHRRVDHARNERILSTACSVPGRSGTRNLSDVWEYHNLSQFWGSSPAKLLFRLEGQTWTCD